MRMPIDTPEQNAPDLEPDGTEPWSGSPESSDATTATQEAPATGRPLPSAPTTDGDDDIQSHGGSRASFGLGGNDSFATYRGSSLHVSGGNHTIVGGPAIDTLSYTDSSAGVSVALDIDRKGTGAGGFAAAPTEGDDFLFGDDNPNTIDGLGGNDVIAGLGGDDHLLGGAGDDQIFGHSFSDGPGDGDDFLDGGIGNDMLIGNAGNDRLRGGDDIDQLSGGEGDDLLRGGKGADTIFGEAGRDFLDYSDSTNGVSVALDDNGNGTGGGGDAAGDIYFDIEGVFGSQFDDILSGNATFNELQGLDGNDYIVGGGGGDILSGHGGDDQIFGHSLVGGPGDGGDTLSGEIGNDTLFGNAGHDRLFGGDDFDQLSGDEGDDLLSGGKGADAIIGGAGIDTLDYSDSTHGVVVALDDNGNGRGSGGDAAGDIYLGIENIDGSTFRDFLTGNASANVINGLGGNDVIAGLGGADLLIGGAGDDQIFGNRFEGGPGDGDDTLQGYDGNDMLIGNEGNDRLAGGDDIDQLSGSEGDDILNGGKGADTIFGDAGIDTLSYFDSTNGVSVALDDNGNGTGSGGDAAGDIYFGIENITGSVFRDFLTGNASANVIEGFDGNDVMAGLGGADVLFGGAGDDQIFGNRFEGGPGDGDDTLQGGAGNDMLIGNDGNDRLFGGLDSDQLSGGLGGDSLIGGQGADGFFYSAIEESQNILINGVSQLDTINDFTRGQDRIGLSPIDANSELAGDQAFVFLADPANHTGSWAGLVWQTGGMINVSIDADADAEMQISILNSTQFTASDFFL